MRVAHRQLPIRVPHPPPHRGRRILGRPRREKLFHHRRVAFGRSDLQRSISILRRGSDQARNPSLRARACAPSPPSPADPSAPHLHRGAITYQSRKGDPPLTVGALFMVCSREERRKGPHERPAHTRKRLSLILQPIRIPRKYETLQLVRRDHPASLAKNQELHQQSRNLKF